MGPLEKMLLSKANLDLLDLGFPMDEVFVLHSSVTFLALFSDFGGG